MDTARAPQGVGRGFREPEMPHLVFFDQAHHGTHGFFGRRRRVDPLLAIEIDMIHAEALEARIAGFIEVVRPRLVTVVLSGRADD